MSKILFNQTASPIIIADVGNVVVPASPSSYTIPPQDYLLWAASSNIVTFVGSGDIVVNDGSFDLSISDGIDLIKGIFPRNGVQTPHAPLTIPITLANTEYFQALPAGTRRYAFRNRDIGLVQYSYEVGTSGTDFATLFPGNEKSEDNVLGPVTLYVQSPKAAQTLEIEYWT